jgi:hypothetical protein
MLRTNSIFNSLSSPNETPANEIVEHDIFISFDESIHDKVLKLYTSLLNNFDISIFLDQPDIDLTMNRQYKRILRNMLRSKFIICCVTKDYIKSRKCKDELIMAYTSSKPILVLMFQEIRLDDLGLVGCLANGNPKIPVYNYLKSKNPWNGSLIAEIGMSIQTVLHRKLAVSSNKERRRAVHTVYIPFGTVMKSNDSGYEDDCGRSDDDDDETNLQNLHKIGITDIGPDYDQVFLESNKANLKHFKRNPLFKSAYGFNRMVYLESKKRFLITSACNNTIISIDLNGNWLEKRNPGGLLKQPYAICVDCHEQIFVGDNELKCIFIFDSRLKHLRTIGQNFLNGFFDMVIDDETGVLYAVNIYDSTVISIDVENNVILNSIYISTPAFISLLPNEIVCLTAEDKIYVVEKSLNDVRFKFSIKRSKFLTGLCTFSQNVIIVAAHEILVDKSRSKNVYLCASKIDGRNVSIRKICLDSDQINDMIMMKQSMVCVNDTHSDVFKYDDINELLSWDTGNVDFD